MLSKTNPPFSTKVFRRLSIGLVGLSALLLLVVMYITLSRATIIIEPKEETVSADLLVTVREDNLKSGDILGKVGITTVSREATFAPSGPGEERPARASGEVIIYNQHTAGQTLVGKTRFLSDSGVLFRLKETVFVPPGGQIKAAIAADMEGKEGNIGPAAFTIPGLNKALQSKIYGKSEAAMTGGTRTVSVITEKDINEAYESMKSSLAVEAADKLKVFLDLARSGQLTNIAYKSEVKKEEASVRAGDEAESFKVNIELDVIGVAYNITLADYAAKTLGSMIPSDRRLVSSNILDLKPTIEKYDLEDKSANLKVSLIGKTVISDNSPVFDKNKLAGMNEDSVKRYLEKYAGVKSVEIEFFPFWLDRVPKLRDHIKIIVK